jgi:hypothetical protein
MAVAEIDRLVPSGEGWAAAPVVASSAEIKRIVRIK